MKSGYDQNIVIDLEFAPVPRKAGADLRFEVIQIGAVRVDAAGRKVDSFCRMVRPEAVTDIARHVRRITGISWSDVCGAATFAEVLGELAAWIGEEPRTRMVAWSESDLRQVERECAAKGVEVPTCMRGRWMDLQRVFPRVMGVGKRRGKMALHTAVEWYGAELGRADEHTAIADAEHTADLLCMLMTGEHVAQRAAWAAAMPARATEGARVAMPSAAEPKGSMAKQLEALYRQMCCLQAAAAACA